MSVNRGVTGGEVPSADICIVQMMVGREMLSCMRGANRMTGITYFGNGPETDCHNLFILILGSQTLFREF